MAQCGIWERPINHNKIPMTTIKRKDTNRILENIPTSKKSLTTTGWFVEIETPAAGTL